MFRIAALPQINNRRSNQIGSTPIVKTGAIAAARSTRPATAEIRIRKFEESSVNEESYTAILPREALTPVELLRAITEACQDLPDFQVRTAEDEQFILTLVLKG